MPNCRIRATGSGRIHFHVFSLLLISSHLCVVHLKQHLCMLLTLFSADNLSSLHGKCMQKKTIKRTRKWIRRQPEGWSPAWWCCSGVPASCERCLLPLDPVGGPPGRRADDDFIKSLRAKSPIKLLSIFHFLPRTARGATYPGAQKMLT